MSRIADALKRSGHAAGLGIAGGRALEGNRLFGSGERVAAAPWDLTAEGPAAEPPQPVPALKPARTPLPRFAALEAVVRRSHLVRPRSEKLIGSLAVDVSVREQYRTLATKLLRAQLVSGIKVVMLTSSVPGEGKTLTAANLAITFSESHDRRVLLVDADLRRPAVHEMFGISNERGLGDSLAEDAHVALTQLTSRLSVLTAGRCNGDPMRTLTSDRMRALLEGARARYEWIILDTAPVGLLSDASLLAAMADTTLLVVRAGHTNYEAIQQARLALDASNIFGVVLNGANGTEQLFPYYGYYSSDEFKQPRLEA